MSSVTPEELYEEEKQELTPDMLTRLAELAQKQMDIEDSLILAQDKVKELTKQLIQVSHTDIPDLLQETGLSELRLANKVKVIVDEKLRVSTTGKYRAIINKWAKENDLEDIIKNEVTVTFGKGEGDDADKLVATIEAQGIETFDQKEYVHSATFAATLRELLEDGVDVPLDDLGVMVQKITKLQRP